MISKKQLKKLFLISTLFTIFINISCKNNDAINKKAEENLTYVDSIEDFTNDHVAVSSEQINSVAFSDRINNSEKVYFTRVLVWNDDFGDIFYHPDLPIILEGKFDIDNHLFIEIGREKFESKFIYDGEKLIIENKNDFLKEKKYSYDIEFRDDYTLLIDKSIKPSPKKTGLFGGIVAGMIIYNSNPYDNREAYQNILDKDFKNE